VRVDRVETVTASAGERVSLRLVVRIADGYHVQANPASGPFLIPLEWTPGTAEDIRVAEVRYPEAVLHPLDGAPSPLRTYEGRREIRATVVVEVHARAGIRELVGTLRYQACDDRRCFAPATVGVAARIRVEEGA
jgi:hypothetical protein